MAAEFVNLCLDGDLEGVRDSLQSGVDVKSRGALGETGLMEALFRRHTAVASLLLEQGGLDVNISDDFGDTALHYAATNGARQRHKNPRPPNILHLLCIWVKCSGPFS